VLFATASCDKPGQNTSTSKGTPEEKQIQVIHNELEDYEKSLRHRMLGANVGYYTFWIGATALGAAAAFALKSDFFKRHKRWGSDAAAGLAALAALLTALNANLHFDAKAADASRCHAAVYKLRLALEQGKKEPGAVASELASIRVWDEGNLDLAPPATQP
jgi:hypothetical protein